MVVSGNFLKCINGAHSIMILIQQVDPTRAEIVDLIHQLDEYQESMYPPESNHLESIDELSKTNIDFLAAYADSEICGIGAVKVLND
jgi:putative acetyltransferase